VIPPPKAPYSFREKKFDIREIHREPGKKNHLWEKNQLALEGRVTRKKKGRSFCGGEGKEKRKDMF